ncbi:hypothetical protein AB0M28_04955 [Streptomyces sp. NPDC051940]|uniref:SCO4225 family membrane protein n=1 Tax=Streptomyces sp. NPDC051940 TaxID=3155675 RepID=UPI003422F46E
MTKLKTLRAYPLTLAYLALALASMGVLAYDDLFAQHADASFAAIYPIFTTLPTGLLFLALIPEPSDGPTWWSTPALYTALLLAMLLNATILAYAEHRWFRARPARLPQGWQQP